MYTAIYTALTGVPSERLKIPGGDHIETRSVRQYLNNLETTLKTAKIDARSAERPYSSLSWRGNDLANMERRSRIQSGKSSCVSQQSRPGSQVSRPGSIFSHPGSRSHSRPVSGMTDYTGTALSPKSNLMYLPASERYLLESGKQRLLNRDSMERKLKSKEGYSPTSPPQLSPNGESLSSSPVKHISVDIKSSEIEDSNEKRLVGVLVDSYGNELEKTGVKFKSANLPNRSPVEPPGRETPPERLFRRYGSPPGMDIGKEGMELIVARGGEQLSSRTRESGTMLRRDSSQTKPVRPRGSARSIGSSMYTSASGTTDASTKSHKSTCDIPAGPHSIHISNARTITYGPHSSLNSLMGYTGPKDISKTIHHKSAWYHVPGRYSTSQKKAPPKRSQQREEAKLLKKSIHRNEPDPYKMFMKSDYRKNDPKNIGAHYPGLNGHTCKKGHLYPPYPKTDKKLYVVCDKCRKEADDILAAHERELLGIVEGSLDADAVGLTPTVNGLVTADMPRQGGYMVEEVMIPEEVEYTYPHTGTTVTFKDTVVMN